VCGFKSAGKTTLGKKMALELKRPFIDTDLLIPCHYLPKNREVFRHYEKMAIASLQGVKESIIATGGGAILDEESRKILKKLGKIIYLQVNKEIIKSRLLKEPLPLFLDPFDPEGSFEKMYAEREPLYLSLADIVYPGYT
jgi:shikimate kinase